MYVYVLLKYQPFQLYARMRGWRRRDDALHWVLVVGPDVKMESTPIFTLGKLSFWNWSPSYNI